MIVRQATSADHPMWAAMLAKLHDGDEAEFLDEIPGWLALSEPMVCWLAFEDGDEPIGMVDARIRNYAEGAPNLRAAYVEDLWVEPSCRRRQVATALLAAVEAWGRSHGLDWIGSDTDLHNDVSRAWHEAAGFEEVERLIVFGKPLS